MALGARPSPPTLPAAAAVVSEPIRAPRNTPCSQLKASVMRGMSWDRRPPRMIAEMGTPFGLSYSLESVGQLVSDTVNREFGWAALVALVLSQGCPCQSTICSGTDPSSPSH